MPPNLSLTSRPPASITSLQLCSQSFSCQSLGFLYNTETTYTVGGPIAVVRNGDIVTISAKTNTLSMNVSDEEIAYRLKSWKPPRSAVNRGVLAKYQRLVGDASHGAMTDLF